jgi:phosphoglucomutase
MVWLSWGLGKFMKREDLFYLKTGTDVRGIWAGEKKNFSRREVELIARAFVIWIGKVKRLSLCNVKVAVGHDSRLSSVDFKNASIEGIINCEAKALDCGLSSTPAMFMSTIFDEFKADGAIEITASHLPYNYNGMKFFTREGGLEDDDIKEILEIAGLLESKSADWSNGKVEKVNLMEVYSKYLQEKIIEGIDKDNRTPLSGFKIIVDAGNGVGGFYAERVLKTLGADIEGSQFLEPDGNFPNHIPNPENKEAMASLKKSVLENKSDIGIIFDTDVDRVAVVDKDGVEINKNKLIALMSNIVLDENPNSYIVTDSITSTGLTNFIEEIGGKHHRFKRGYKNVINEAIRLNKEGKSCSLAIETSGHAALKENFFLDDGAYLVSKILIKFVQLRKENKDIKDLINKLIVPKGAYEYRINISSDNVKESSAAVLNELKEKIKTISYLEEDNNNYEGVRVNYNLDNDKGWFLLRSSLHEPVLALNIESDNSEDIGTVLDEIKKILQKFQFLKLNF